MTVVGVIPARWGSTRLPGKSLLPLCGKPLVQWVYERALRARALEAVVVATDDERIRSAVEAFGGRAVMTRADHPSGTDRVAEAARALGADAVVNIQGDEPLIDPGLIDRVAGALVDSPDWDMSTAAAPIRSERDLAAASVVKVVWDATGRALYFSRSVIPFVRDAAPEGLTHWRHIGIYGYRSLFLERLVQTPPCVTERAEKLEQLRALHIGGRIRVLTADEAGIGVDTHEDIAYAESAIERAIGGAKRT